MWDLIKRHWIVKPFFCVWKSLDSEGLCVFVAWLQKKGNIQMVTLVFYLFTEFSGASEKEAQYFFKQ